MKEIQRRKHFRQCRCLCTNGKTDRRSIQLYRRNILVGRIRTYVDGKLRSVKMQSVCNTLLAQNFALYFSIFIDGRSPSQVGNFLSYRGPKELAQKFLAYITYANRNLSIVKDLKNKAVIFSALRIILRKKSVRMELSCISSVKRYSNNFYWCILMNKYRRCKIRVF